ncbi:hypothetical protein EDB89DRAFT_946788 [Lactarius sanguifluus]|nr:hypothetical protein EDB89DRAFT_946788 [Lactarius sanguifluus]
MTTSEPTLSLLAWLTASARHPVHFVRASLCQGWQNERALHPHAPKVVDEPDILLLILDTHPTGATISWSSEEEVRGGGQAARDRVQHHRLNAPRERSGICCGTSAPTMPFCSMSSRQRTNLSFGTAPAFSFFEHHRCFPECRQRQPNQHP